MAGNRLRKEAEMKDGYRVLDMDTHVNPSLEVLAKYVDPSFRPRLEELKPYHRVRHQPRPDGTVQITTGLTVAPIPYDRFPGEAPRAVERRPQAPRGGGGRGGGGDGALGAGAVLGGSLNPSPERKTNQPPRLRPALAHDDRARPPPHPPHFLRETAVFPWVSGHLG